MIDRATKLRWRRRVKRSRRQVEDIGVQTEENLERHFFRRIARLYEVRRFLLSWLILIFVLITGVVLQTRSLGGYYQTLKPVPGGTYTEGILGAFTNANPIYASGGVDGTVSRLIFSGLMKYDNKNQLIGDLAERWESNEEGSRYTVYLKDNLKWHDGQPLTAADVIFTYQVIQNPDSKSPLSPSWRGIVLEQIDERTVAFTLPNTLSSFPYALTNGIIPKHLLEDLPVSQLRSARFNTVGPVGSGPFKWDAIEVTGLTAETRQEKIGLVPNPLYHGEVVKLQQFIVVSYRDEQKLLESFQNNEVNAAVGLDSVPDTLAEQPNVKIHSIPLTGQVVVFFKTSSPLFQDVKIRQALVQAIDTKKITAGLSHDVIAANSPLLISHVGYDKNLTQLPTNIDAANELLNNNGWVAGPDGIRMKGDQELTFRLTVLNTSEYAYVTQTLQQQWRAIGVRVEVTLETDRDLQATVAEHNYDALLYGISLGVDPDVFAYWHSSQADPRAATRLNLSEYKSAASDRALEAGRTRLDNDLRAAKYRPFLEAWRNDAPALVLYQPRFLYLTRGEVFGFSAHVLNNATERLNNVENWMIREVKANK